MPGQFANLKPDNKARLSFWKKNEKQILALLKEVNSDVFDGKGKFEKAHFEGSYRIEPQLVEPNLFISFRHHGSISVCTASTSRLRVIVEKWSINNEWKSWECDPHSLAAVLKVYVKYLVG